MSVARPVEAGKEYVPLTVSLAGVPAELMSIVPDEIAPAPFATSGPAIVCGEAGEAGERPVVCNA